MDEAYSNFDHAWTDGAKAAIDSGATLQHSAWDFCGYISKNGDVYEEEVWRFGAPVTTFSAPDLDELVQEVNEEFGFD